MSLRSAAAAVCVGVVIVIVGNLAFGRTDDGQVQFERILVGIFGVVSVVFLSLFLNRKSLKNG